MKNNYPVKYAVMPIQNSNGETIANIVSKCYIISEEKNYSLDGNFKINYDVFLPYQFDMSESCWKREEPTFNAYSFKCTNATVVNDIFDNYEDALKLATLKNDEILENNYGYISNISEIERIKFNHDKKISEYKELEEQIFTNTVDLKVNSDSKPQIVQCAIVFSNGKELVNLDYFKNTSLYSCINFLDEFYAYSVSKQDFYDINDKIKNFSNYDEFKQNVLPNYDDSKYLLFNNLKTGITEIINPKLNGEKGLYYLKDGKMYYDKNMKSFAQKPDFDNGDVTMIYTMESYEDILASYLPNFNSESSKIEIGGVVLKKKLKW